MISIWHLLWIVPVSASIGGIIFGLCSADTLTHEKETIYKEGYLKGVKQSLKLVENGDSDEG